MNHSTHIASRIEEFAHRGVRLSLTPRGTFQIHPSSAITHDDRAWFREHAPAVIEYLKVRLEVWDQTTANGLATDADSLLGQLGVSGTHPLVQTAAERVVSASGDMAAFRRAISEYEATVRSLSAQRAAA